MIRFFAIRSLSDYFISAFILVIYQKKKNRLKLLTQASQYNFAYVCLVILALVLPTINCDAQNSIEIDPLAGIKVNSPGNFPLAGKSYGIEAAYNMFQRNRSEEWIKRLHVRDIAIVGGYRNLNNVYITDTADSKGFLGSIFSISGRLNFNLANFNKTEVLLLTSVGITYSSSSFFSDGNPIVGSRLNFSPQVGIKIRTPLSMSTSLVAGVDFFHYSNVGFQTPNKGVNSSELSLGIIQDVSTAEKKTVQRKPDNVRSFIDLGADIGRRGSFESRAGNWKSGLYAAYNYKLNPVISIKAGGDAIYYFTTFDQTGASFQYYATSYDHWRAGVSLGSDVWLGKLVFMSSYGYYLKYNSYYPIKYYGTTGFKYYINEWSGIQMKIYFHKGQADYCGFGLAFRIPTNKFY